MVSAIVPGVASLDADILQTFADFRVLSPSVVLLAFVFIW